MKLFYRCGFPRSSQVSQLKCIFVHQVFFILILFNSICSPCLSSPFVNSICWGMGKRKDINAWLGSLETFHQRCLLLFLKLPPLTPSIFQHLSRWSEPKWDIYQPSVNSLCSCLCLAVCFLTKHLAAFNSLTMSLGTNIVPLLMKIRKTEMSVWHACLIMKSFFKSCFIESQVLIYTKGILMLLSIHIVSMLFKNI